jgi:L-lactate dehydrogenase (cytochrome)
MRTKFEGGASSQQSQGKDNFRRDQGAARAISSFIDPSLNWADLPELMEAAKGMKIILKGVQCWEVGLNTGRLGRTDWHRMRSGLQKLVVMEWS